MPNVQFWVSIAAAYVRVAAGRRGLGTADWAGCLARRQGLANGRRRDTRVPSAGAGPTLGDSTTSERLRDQGLRLWRWAVRSFQELRLMLLVYRRVFRGVGLVQLADQPVEPGGQDDDEP